MDGGFTGVDANPRVCLDFGTSFSKAGVYLGAQAGDACLAPLRLGAVSGAEHPYFTPTALYFEPDRVHCGPKALIRARSGVRAKRDPILSFKMVLSALDVEGTLALKLSPSVDPSRSMTYRDAIVLYFAYLDQVVRAAILIDERLPNHLVDAPLRLTSPLWRREHDAEQTLSRLFHEAEVTSALLGARLMSPDGADLGEARAALSEAARTPRRGRFAGIVSEVEAVAAAYANFATTDSDCLLAMDVGAGTTDIAGFKIIRRGAATALDEIKPARKCLALGGDEVDNAVVHNMLCRSGVLSAEAKARAWRALRLSARELKHDVIERGKCALVHDGRKIVMRQDALIKDPGFKDLKRALIHALSESMEAACDAIGNRTVSMTVCLAGGGAHLPVMNEIVAEAAKRRRGALKVTTERFSFGLAQHRIAPVTDRFDKSFTQAVIALGGAIADLPQAAASADRAA